MRMISTVTRHFRRTPGWCTAHRTPARLTTCIQCSINIIITIFSSSSSQRFIYNDSQSSASQLVRHRTCYNPQPAVSGDRAHAVRDRTFSRDRMWRHTHHHHHYLQQQQQHLGLQTAADRRWLDVTTIVGIATDEDVSTGATVSAGSYAIRGNDADRHSSEACAPVQVPADRCHDVLAAAPATSDRLTVEQHQHTTCSGTAAARPPTVCPSHMYESPRFQ